MFLWRAILVWLVIAAAETVHGVARRVLLDPWLGDLHARQLSVVTGSVIILVIAYLFGPWLKANGNLQLLLVGVVWVLLMLIFEFGVGIFALGYSWASVSSDYDISNGGFLGIGMALMAAAPWLASKLRNCVSRR